ncbi:MAG: tetratricopeptide repeat protein [Candidatus Omnitrophica bacterium]|nr:tetratricopeptide repeat protein [Candidatus Omnitrophota bacterium]
MTIGAYIRICAVSIVVCTSCCLFPHRAISAVESAAKKDAPTPLPAASDSKPELKDLVRNAWSASSKADWDQLTSVFDQTVKLYGEEASKECAKLSGFPSRDVIEKYKVMNDVATVYFIMAEGLMYQGKSEEATALFQETIQTYKWAQAFDPSRGGYWSIAEKSQASIDVISGKITQEEEVNDKKPVLQTMPNLVNSGKDEIVDYTKYGNFLNVGTKDYHYQIKDVKVLAEAVGEGIYPNLTDIYKNPNYKKAVAEGRLEGSHWDFVRKDDLEAAIFKWATAPEPWGVRLFYMGMIYEKAKMYKQALKAYHALIVHYPNATAWTYWQTPWYPAQAAIAKIKHIVREHPELNLKFKWGKITIDNAFDNDTKNDIVITSPGVIEIKTEEDITNEKLGLDKKKVKLTSQKRTLGQGRVQLVQYTNGHWQMTVDGKPYVIHGITYAPTKVGQTPDKGTVSNWMTDDFNKNGLIDGPYESWVDKNLNNVQDSDEPVVGDFQLMKEMGVNTLRVYHQPLEPDKKILQELYEKFGIRVIMGDFVGKYTLGSGAAWADGTDYENPEHRKHMMESVTKMVMDHKDEPYLLLWLLGNENNYGVASNADKKPEAYYKFINEVALMIKKLDPDHPVALCNGDTLFLDIFAKNSPDVDIYAANVYRGDYGFGSFWDQLHDATDKPAFITEYGAPAYTPHMSVQEGEDAQAEYHRGNWLDIDENLAEYEQGAGNALGGVAFEWMDEWWKNYEPFKHDKKSDVIGPFPGGYYYEEWFGLVGQGNGKSSPYLRQLRKVYHMYQDLWNR